MLSKKIGMLFTFLDSALLPQLLNGLYEEGGDEMKGFYFAHRLTDEIGQFKKTGKHYDIASILEAMRK